MMVTISKLLIGIIATLTLNSTDTYKYIEPYNKKTELHLLVITSKLSNEKAFQILNNKCNVCHRKQNKRRVFTSENMNTWAKDIYKQVFIKKRMPKGKKIKLTSNEYQELLTWITSTKSNQNGNKL